MKKLLFILLLTSNTLCAQDFSGYYITKNSDTIDCTIHLKRRLFYYNDFAQLIESVTLVDFEREKLFYPGDILCFVLNVTNDKAYRFVSIEGDMKRFYHEIIKGRISLYKTYSYNAYDGSLEITPIIMKGNKQFYLGMMNMKPRVAKFIGDNPAIMEKWKATEINLWTTNWSDTSKLEKIINEYNESAKNLEPGSTTQ